MVHLEELCLDLLQLFDRDARLLQHRQKGLRRFTDQSVDLLNDSDCVLVLLHFRLVNHDQLFKGVLWGGLLLLLLEGHELLELLGLLQLLLGGHLTVGGLDQWLEGNKLLLLMLEEGGCLLLLQLLALGLVLSEKIGLVCLWVEPMLTMLFATTKCTCDVLIEFGGPCRGHRPCSDRHLLDLCVTVAHRGIGLTGSRDFGIGS